MSDDLAVIQATAQMMALLQEKLPQVAATTFKVPDDSVDMTGIVAQLGDERITDIPHAFFPGKTPRRCRRRKRLIAWPY